ncbi:MAG: hypothetical protein ACRDCJ_01890 [Metamycoplasmataceae bacterium]
MKKFYCLYNRNNLPFSWKLKQANEKPLAHFKSREDCLNYYLSFNNVGIIWFQKASTKATRKENLKDSFDGYIKSEMQDDVLVHTIGVVPGTKENAARILKRNLFHSLQIDPETGRDLLDEKGIDRLYNNKNSYLIFDNDVAEEISTVYDAKPIKIEKEEVQTVDDNTYPIEPQHSETYRPEVIRDMVRNAPSNIKDEKVNQKDIVLDIDVAYNDTNNTKQENINSINNKIEKPENNGTNTTGDYEIERPENYGTNTTGNYEIERPENYRTNTTGNYEIERPENYRTNTTGDYEIERTENYRTNTTGNYEIERQENNGTNTTGNYEIELPENNITGNNRNQQMNFMNTQPYVFASDYNYNPNYNYQNYGMMNRGAFGVNVNDFNFKSDFGNYQFKFKPPSNQYFLNDNFGNNSNNNGKILENNFHNIYGIKGAEMNSNDNRFNTTNFNNGSNDVWVPVGQQNNNSNIQRPYNGTVEFTAVPNQMLNTDSNPLGANTMIFNPYTMGGSSYNNTNSNVTETLIQPIIQPVIQQSNQQNSKVSSRTTILEPIVNEPIVADENSVFDPYFYAQYATSTLNLPNQNRQSETSEFAFRNDANATRERGLAERPPRPSSATQQQRMTRNTAVTRGQKPMLRTAEKTLNARTKELSNTNDSEAVKKPKSRKLFYWIMSIVLVIMIAAIVVASLVVANIINIPM